MQIAMDHPVCPACRGRAEFSPVLHHMICAYVGPGYDFTEAGESHVCPKCRREIVSGTCEIVGTSALRAMSEGDGGDASGSGSSRGLARTAPHTPSLPGGEVDAR
jgi:rubredoxin